MTSHIAKEVVIPFGLLEEDTNVMVEGLEMHKRRAQVYVIFSELQLYQSSSL